MQCKEKHIQTKRDKTQTYNSFKDVIVQSSNSYNYSTLFSPHELKKSDQINVSKEPLEIEGQIKPTLMYYPRNLAMKYALIKLPNLSFFYLSSSQRSIKLKLRSMDSVNFIGTSKSNSFVFEFFNKKDYYIASFSLKNKVEILEYTTTPN